MTVIVIEECQLILLTVTFTIMFVIIIRYYVFYSYQIKLCVQQYRCSSTYLLDVPVYPIEIWVTFMIQILNYYFSLLYLNSYYVDKKEIPDKDYFFNTANPSWTIICLENLNLTYNTDKTWKVNKIQQDLDQ